MSPAHETPTAHSMVLAMTRHFSHDVGDGVPHPPDCLCFPAGPLLPKASTHSRPLVPHGLNNHKRTSLAFELFPDSKGSQHQDKDYEGLLSGLHSLSAFGWQNNHGFANQPFTRADATAMVDAWKPLLVRRTKESIDDHRSRQTVRHECMAERLLDKWDRTHSSPASPPAAAGPLDAAQKASAIEAIRCFMDAHPDQPDLLLQRFWLKRLQVHHGFHWEATNADVAGVHPVHLSALYMLRHVFEPSLAGWAQRLSAPELFATDPRLGRTEAAKALKEARSAWTDRMLQTAVDTSPRLPDCLCPFEPELALTWAQYTLAREQRRTEAQAAEDAAAQAENRKPRKVQIPPEPFAHWPAPHVSLQQALDLWQALGRSPDELQAAEDLAQYVAESLRGPGVPRSAFAGPAYVCDCTPRASDTATAQLGDPVGASPASIDAAMQASRLRGGPAALLLRFFLQQVLSHHGYSWTHSTPGNEVHFYFSAVLGLLQALKKHPDAGELAAVARLWRTEQARTALGTANGEAWLKDLRQADQVNGQKLRHRLPAAFCPGELGDPARHLSVVRELESRLNLPPDSLQAADRLARDIASLMTDPWLAACLPWAGHEPFGSLADGAPTAVERRRAFHQLLGRYAERLKSDARPSLVQRFAPGSPSAPIIDRMRAIHKYLSYTDEHWNGLKNRLKAEGVAP